jgi:hypothetical protein
MGYARFIIALLILTVVFSARIDAETVTWINPTTYTDNTVIPTAKQSLLSTDIQYRIGAGSWVNFGTALNGAATFNAPYITTPGGTSYWRLRSISVADNNSTSVWSPEYTFVRPFQVPGPGQVQDVR